MDVSINLRTVGTPSPTAPSSRGNSRTPSPSGAQASVEGTADRTLSLDEKLAKASELLNSDKPREALKLLKPLAGDQQAKAHYGFQSRLGNAYMGVADTLVAANQLGSFLVAPDSAGSFLHPTIHAERITCYLGVLAAYGQFLTILQKPAERARFIEKNGEQTLEHVEMGVRAGIAHAMLEPTILLSKISQVNSNMASQNFVQRALASGQLTEESSVVQSFREVERDPLYRPIADATHCIRQAVAESGQVPQMFWFGWFQNEKQKLLQLPDYQLGAAYNA